MSALAEQHERWVGARSRLWRALPAVVKPTRERPVSPFVREAQERRERALKSIANAFPPPGKHRLFAAPIIRLDEDGNPLPDDVERAQDNPLVPKWKQIALDVGKKHGVKLNEITSIRRARYIVLARDEALWRCRNETSLSFPQIGRLFGGRDHSTILVAIRRHEKRMREAANASN